MNLRLIVNKFRFEEKSDANLAKRFFAYFIDWYIGGVISSLPVEIIYQFTVKKELILADSLFVLPRNYAILAGVLSLIIAFLYYVIVPTYIWKGQTLGKKLLKLQIVKDDYSEVTFKDVFMRQFVFMLIVEGRFIMPSTTLHELIALILQYNVVNIFTYISYCVTLISVVIATQLKSQRTLHDIFSHTKVMMYDSPIVKTEMKKKIKKAKKINKTNK